MIIKRIIAALSIAFLILCIASCSGGKDNDQSGQISDNSPESTADTAVSVPEFSYRNELPIIGD